MAGLPQGIEHGGNSVEHSNFRAGSSAFSDGVTPLQLPLTDFALPPLNSEAVQIKRPETTPIPEIDLSILRLPVEGATLRDQLPFPLVDLRIREILLDNGAEEDQVNQVFNENGEWILYGKDDIQDLYSLPVFVVKQQLAEKFSKVYNLVDYRLRADKSPHGYNGHDMQHIYPVAEQTEELLTMAGYGEDTVRMGVIAAMIHDLGNVSRRSGHSLDSTAIALAVAPSLLQSPSRFSTISQAARLHDEKALKSDLGINGTGTAIRDTAKIKEFGPVLAALVMADKTDIGRHRTNRWATNPDVLNGDEHAFLNFFGENHGFTLRESEEGRELVWQLRYRPDVTKDEYDRFAALARDSENHEDYAALVPQWVQEAYRQGRTSHFKEWAQTTFRTYEDRIKLTAKCAMALFDIDYFTVEMYDPTNKYREKAGTRHTETFDREILDQGERKFDLMYVPYDVRQERRSSNNAKARSESVATASERDDNVVYVSNSREVYAPDGLEVFIK